MTTTSSTILLELAPTLTASSFSSRESCVEGSQKAALQPYGHSVLFRLFAQPANDVFLSRLRPTLKTERERCVFFCARLLACLRRKGVANKAMTAGR